ncbi:MAG: bifunctional methylenetetrahydrofolate dehydrogenase/methenyltetrahydrofolate cyclohydrolase [Candidatus Ancillula sp.]|jgi:methylenetetrahydrofolate dehydrogenase (NADP+)/methenyltetrahydrofolate cyclohydrolase|nr:bifunctional methylenetetrahydrofolate dehydrogenase/methenyltetrahydrofolate cyclohydrolase [Candidatus Ancillula sp.]
MSQVLDGKLFASEVKNYIKERVLRLNELGITPGLGTILVGDDIGSQKYVAGKHRDCAEVGIRSVEVTLDGQSTEQEILDEITRLNNDPACSSYIVQLPLPKGVNEQKILEAINPKKDADGLHPFNLGSLVLNSSASLNTPVPCTPYGIIKFVEHFLGQGFWKGKEVVVIGRGITVGRSIGALLTRKDCNATVTLTHTGTKNLPEVVHRADVVIAAVGSAYLVKPDWIKDGAVLIDVGVSRTVTQEGKSKIQGDIDPDCYSKASWYTPNPGGVGPVTRAMLLENVVSTAERLSGKK